MTDTIVIYRKGSHAPKVNASTIKDVRATIAGKCRVQRPGIMALFIPSKAGQRSTFYRLPELSPQIIDNPWVRATDHSEAGWVVPTDSLGRKGEATASTAQSILLWVKQNMADVVDPADVSVVVEDR